MFDKSGPYANAKRRFDVEVEAEAARLIEAGTSPWAAVARAVRNVEIRRKCRRRASDAREVQR
jgi:hypothetical protein